MGMIHVLDQHTAELIAAGEVVERPASVVKELTENAIDAGAKSITIQIERGGISMIQIADDGCGIEAEDISTAFIRHATSKIEREEDLSGIHTLGFRGEALASIASVSRVELLTRTTADEYAYLYRVCGGVEQSIEPAARPIGTTVTVRDLFYNTPARMKFLKKDSSEGNFVTDIVKQLSISHPDIVFKYIREGKPQFQTPGDGSLLSTAYAVLSREFARETLPVKGTVREYTVYGLATLPQNARASRSMQFFYVNGRFVRDRTMMAALEAAYKGTVMQGKYPGCILFLEMPPALVDVNVHPAKTEIRFAQERDVFDAVYQVVKECVYAQIHREPAAAFDKETDGESLTRAFPPPPGHIAESEGSKEEPRRAGEDAESADAPRSRMTADVRATRFPVDERVPTPILQGSGVPPGTLASESNVPYRLDSPEKPLQPDNTACAPAPADEKLPAAKPRQTVLPFAQQEEDDTLPLRFVGEVFGTYIVTQRGEDLCFLDKHAAHERILYESLIASRGQTSSQMLLAPVTVHLSAEEKDALLQSNILLQENGLEIEDFGGDCVVVRAVPADIETDDVPDLVEELAGRLVTDPHAATSEKTEWVLASVACRAAIKAGDKTHTEELMCLAKKILDGAVPPFCPHGRPIVLKISRKELEKRFGRQG